MADRPILFSAPMVRALHDGRKTQTRRVLNPQPPGWIYPNDKPGYSCLTPKGSIEFRGRYIDEKGEDHGPASKFLKLPFLKKDRLWVREAYFQRGHWEPVEGARTKGGKQKWRFVPADYFYTFDEPAEYRKGRHHNDPATVAWHKRLGRFMPRSLSRFTLTVTDVRVERLQDISGRDAVAEGVQSRLPDNGIAQQEYADLWDSINGPGAWYANPWVVAVTFSIAHHNIDAGPA
ncbi:hypothetical protein [Novosphingobium sp. SG707]|uniref:hypothetical protein n=1 Tax=Novosphingobium sp. SG707 TaxID=2586996 RepID=UPI001445DDEF|nr:hypothetical protein [Novosphingobium sp. SG707]NKI99624.1 hypothetical protein [Novosphingobium sp. SG707]